MSNEIDDILDQLKTENRQRQQQKADSNSSPSQKRPPVHPKSGKSIHQMLDELKAEILSGRGRPGYTEAEVASQKVSSNKDTVRQEKQNRERLNAEIDREYQKQERIREEKIAAKKRQQQELIAARKRQEQELIEAQKREELRELRRKAALREKAQEWLKNLNPRSEEAQWFEEFSYSYESKLQAAIDYLEAMRETGL